MSTTRLAIRGVAFNWLGRICAFAITFVVTPILINGLGDESYGIWSIVMSLAAYYALADMGLQSAGTKFISQFEAVGDHPSVNKVIVTSLAVGTLLAAGVAVVAVCLAVAFPYIFVTQQTGPGTLRWVVVLTGLTICLDLIGRVFDAALAALKRFDLRNMVAVGTQLLQATLIIAAITSGGGLLAMAWIVVSVAALTQVVTYALASRVLGHVSLSPRFLEWETAKYLLRFGGLNIVQGLGRRVTKSAGAVIVGIIMGPALVTYYAIAENLTNKLGELSKGVSTVLMPVASQLEAQDRRKDLVRAYLLATRVFAALGLTFTVGFFTLGTPLIDLWIGEGYAELAYPVLCVLAGGMILQMGSNAARAVLKGTNQMGFLAKVGLIDVVLTLALGVTLVMVGGESFGLIGMASAILASQVVTSGAVIPLFVCQRLALPAHRFLIGGVLPGVLAACPAALVALVLVPLAPPSHITHVILEALFVGSIGLAGIFFVCFEKQLRVDVLRSVLGKRILAERSLAERSLAERVEANTPEPCGDDA